MEVAEGWKSHLLYIFFHVPLSSTYPQNSREVCRDVTSPLHPKEALQNAKNCSSSSGQTPLQHHESPAVCHTVWSHNTQPFGWWDRVSGAEGCKRKLSRRHKLLITALNGLTCTWCQNQALTEDAAISYQGSRNYGLGKGKGEHYSSS